MKYFIFGFISTLISHNFLLLIYFPNSISIKLSKTSSGTDIKELLKSISNLNLLNNCIGIFFSKIISSSELSFTSVICLSIYIDSINEEMTIELSMEGISY
jgi:hypothetical protein